MIITPIHVNNRRCIVQPKNVGKIPKLPCRYLVSGQSGSGKSVLIANLLLKKDFYGGCFEHIYLISPTASMDTTYACLEIDSYHIFEPTPRVLNAILETTKERVEQQGYRNTATCLIIDDCVSHHRFLNSPEFSRIFFQGRHHNISIFITTQAYHSVPKRCRLQCTAVAYFKGSNRELKTIVEDFCPSGFSDRQFREIVLRAQQKPYSFLTIDLEAPLDKRYKSCFEERNILNA